MTMETFNPAAFVQLQFERSLGPNGTPLDDTNLQIGSMLEQELRVANRWLDKARIESLCSKPVVTVSGTWVCYALPAVLRGYKHT